MKLLVGENSTTPSGGVACMGHLTSTAFNDLRFTTSDGSTLCDYWIESFSGTTPNQVATVWIEVPSIAASPTNTTIYMYYGGTNSAVSNGANTFLFFDDFERGVNGDGVGGSWIVDNVAHWLIDTSQHYGIGTRSLKQTVGALYSGFVYSNTTGTSVSFRLMSGLDGCQLVYGDGTKRMFVGIDSHYNISGYYDDTGWHWVSTAPQNEWILVEIKNINWTTHTFDLWINGVLGQSACAMATSTDSTGIVVIAPMAVMNTAIYYDNFLIAKSTANEPTWSSFGSESTKGRSFGVIIGRNTSKSFSEIVMCRNELWIS